MVIDSWGLETLKRVESEAEIVSPKQFSSGRKKKPSNPSIITQTDQQQMRKQGQRL